MIHIGQEKDMEKEKWKEQIRSHLADEISAILFDGWWGYMEKGDERALGRMVRRYFLDAQDPIKKDSPGLFQLLKEQEQAARSKKEVFFSVQDKAQLRQMRFWHGFGVKIGGALCKEEGLLSQRLPQDPPFFLEDGPALASASKTASPGSGLSVPEASPSRSVLPSTLDSRIFTRQTYSELADCYLDRQILRPEHLACFVDGGALDLFHSYRFACKSRDRYQAIYAFEPDPEGEPSNLALFDDRMHFLPVALWDKKEPVPFSSRGADSCCTLTGSMTVQGDTLDHLLHGISPTFIKLHLEGAELAALKGAQDTIRRCHPLLAVAIGHRREDILTIPETILKIDDGYQLFLRHYSNSITETVLYAR